MTTTYIPTANSSSGGLALNSNGSLAEVVKLLVGAPVINANIYIFNETNPGGTSNTSGLLAKLTLPAALATGQLPFTIDLTNSKTGEGIQCPMGGNVMTDTNLQLSVMWGTSEEVTQSN